MILFIHSDATYLVLPKARSRIAGYYFLSNNVPDGEDPPLNGAVLVECKKLDPVASSSAKSETGGLYSNAQNGVPMRNNLEFLDHPQPIDKHLYLQQQDSARIALASTEKRHHEVTKELLAKKWGISISRAKATLKASTQLSVRSAIMPLSRRYRTDLLSQRLRRISTCIYTDTLLMKSKSSRSNTCAQVFTDGALAYVHPMQSKADAHEGLAAFGQDVGIPMEMISDNSKEQTAYGSDFMKILRKWRTSSRSIEPYSPWQNLAENVIGILKSKWKRRMVQRNVPAKVWDFGLLWEAEIYTRTAKPGGRTGIEADSLESKRKIGRWLGVSHRVGSAMCYWILSNTCNVLERTTVQHVLQSEYNQEDIQEQIRAYHEAVSDAFGADNFVSDLDGFDKLINEDVPIEKETETGYSVHDDIAVPEIDDVVDHDNTVKQQDTYDMYIGAEVLFPNAVGDE
ncbi:hypothetical protein CTEN210_18599 [Chaetoceros tenuissimus]|uniref:Integrase catalytic domain-containing protein n=1 Tax=Chaetoceros tenuissimus TaxID=426638 RepID=A0AAD3DD00_9STRA|nr:hypothetical protein CTEN210_18599 [Chaetoceros tenuissimus]